MKYFIFLFTVLFFYQPQAGFSQASKDSLSNPTISDCIQYALKHQPVVRQSLVNEKITNESIKANLADWFPQVSFTYSIDNYPQLLTSFVNGSYVTTGTSNSSNLGLAVTQNIFNRDLLLANKTASDLRRQASQQTTNYRINTAAAVSKAFYDVLLTQKQTDIIDEDIARLERSLKDAYNQYKDGIVDKTDYKRATISLNNAKAQRKQIGDAIAARYSDLKEEMGYPDSFALQLNYDTTQIEKDAALDTTLPVTYQNRIEYQLLQTEKNLSLTNIKYYKWAYLPTVGAFGNYNFSYLNNSFGKLYSEEFPNSLFGLQLSLPIFQGFKRVYQVRQAEEQSQLVDLDMVALQNNINKQYGDAMSTYKGNLANYLALKDNVDLANDVYNVIRTQYQLGIKTYLDVIVAESDLRTSQLNFYTALYQLLESKIDVETALGTLRY
jgi:outer membrane protein